jgi:hypothetical protein
MKRAEVPEHLKELLEMKRILGERGINVRLPNPTPGWTLPEPLELQGISLSDAIIRARRGDG